MKLFLAALTARPYRASWLVLLLALAGAKPAPAGAQGSPEQAQSTGSAQPAFPAHDTTGEMNLAAYLAELDRISGAVGRFDKDRAETAALRRSLANTWAVRMAGQRFEVSTAWLNSALETMETNPVVRASLQKDIQNRLQVLRGQAEALEQADAGPRPDEARARLDDILRRREFRSVHGPKWWDRVKARLWARTYEVLRRFFGRLPRSPRAREFVVWGLIALIFLLLALWVRSSLLGAARAKGLEISGALPLGKTWRDWAREALEAAARHDYRVALHRAYWAGVYRLADLGAWQLDRARTPREYVRLLAHEASAPAQLTVAAQAERAAALAALTRSLEATWYGFQPATADDFRAALAQLEALGCRFPSNLATANF